MRGTRYGDFSRFDPDGEPAYTAVLMQQGRVQLDSDFNAEAQLVDRRLRSAVADLLGGDGTPTSDPGFEVRPRIALEFRGDGVAVVDDAPRLRADRCDPMTIEIWPRWIGDPGTLLDWQGREEWALGGVRLYADGDGCVDVVMYEDGDGGVVLSSRRSLPRGRFAHVALVCGEESMHLYIDGERVAEAHRTGPAVGAGRLVIGGAIERRRPCLRGMLGGVRAWRVARRPTGSEVDTRDGLLAWWPLDDGRSEFARDLVGGRRARLEGDPRPSWQLVDFEVEPGRYYVDGIACDLSRRTTYSGQEALPYAPLPRAPGDYVVYLEVWEETVTRVQDPELLDAALGGLDTTVRTRTVSAVRTARLRDGERGSDRHELLAGALAERRPSGRVAADHRGDDPPGNYLYRVEVHNSGQVGGEPGPEVGLYAVRPSRRQVELAEPWPGVLPAGTLVQMTGYDHRHKETRHLYVVAATVDRGRCVELTTEPTAVAELRSARMGVAPATFKWSRRNGADIQAIRPVRDGDTAVRPFGRAAGPAPIAEGDVVEVLDDGVVIDGPPPPLLVVTGVSTSDGLITLSAPVPPGVARERAKHPFLRRWDQRPQPADAAVPIEPEHWIDLELGVRVCFAPGTYRRGDYWWIVTRQDEPELRWPSGPEGPLAVAPEGVERRRAPLALALLGDDDVEVVDLRSTIAPAVGPRFPGSEAPRDGRADDHHEPPDRAEIGDDAEGDDPRAAGPATVPGRPEPPWPPLALPPGFAVAGPPDAHVAGLAPTGLELAIQPRWRRCALGLWTWDLESVAALAGSVLIATTRALWLADPDTGATEWIAELPEVREDYACRVSGRRVYLVGGRTPDGPVDGAILVYDPESGEWSGRDPMPRPVRAPAVAVHRGRIHVLGGATRHWGSRERVQRDHQVFDTERGTWAWSVELPEPRFRARAVALSDWVHVVGGYRGHTADETVRDHDAFVIDQERWTRLEPTPHGQTVRALAAAERELLAVSRRDDDGTDVAHVYEVGRGEWEPVARPAGVARSAGLVVDDARYVLVGVDEAAVVAATLARQRQWELYVAEGRAAPPTG